MKALKNQVLALIQCRPIWRAGLALSAVAILYLATTPGTDLLPPSPSDKLNHLVAFMELTLLARLGWPQARVSSVLILLLGYGVAIEIIQWPLPYREFSVADMVADAAGIALGLALWRWFPTPMPADVKIDQVS